MVTGFQFSVRLSLSSDKCEEGQFIQINMFRKSSDVVKRARKFMSTKTQYTNVKIPMPWGEIAGKWWGSQTQQPVLTLHGWQVFLSFIFKITLYLKTLF